ncbi:MAG: DUF5710 domain-containing protein [Thermoleophilaceae bacterium]
MHERDRIYLDVPYAEKDQAKALGAHWDPHRRQWWAPPDSPGRLVVGLTPSRVCSPGPRSGLRIVQLPERCWKCSQTSRPVVGAELPGYWEAYPDGWADFGWCGEAIVGTLPAELLEAQRIGPIEWRRAKLMPKGLLGQHVPGEPGRRGHLRGINASTYVEGMRYGHHQTTVRALGG